MIKNLFQKLIGFTLVLIPSVVLSQAPNLGAASSFALFTSVGNLSNSGGGSTITGNVGTNSGIVGSLGTVNGSVHVANATTAQAATDLSNAYSYLSGLSCGSTLGTALGTGQVLAPNVHCINAAATLTGTLTLDGQFNPNSIFIIKINSGGLTVANNARVVLTNSASICNVYWQVNGPVTMGTGVIFRGTILANGSISTDNMTQQFGRGLSLGGAITLKNNSISVSLPPVASVISAASSATFCTGGNVVLTGNSGGTWSNASTASSITVSSAGTYYVTNTTMCGSTNSNSISVVVNPLPTVAVNSGTICRGGSITLTASGASTYSWAPGASLSSTSGTTVSASPTVSTIYTVTGTSAAGCVKTATSSVTVVQTPTISVNSTSLCAGTSKTLTATGAVTYTWSPPSGLSGVNGFSVIANPTITTTYTISGTNAGGCTNTTVATVTVVPNPTVSVSSGTICSGNSTTLTATGATTFSWSPSTGINSTTSASVVANPTLTTTYTISGTTDGCVHTTTTTLTVNPLPTATISASGSTTFCQGDSVILTASPGASYLWSTTATTQSISVSTSGTYSVVVTDANGCFASSAAATVVVNPLPPVSVNSGTICSGNSIALNVSGADTYSWSPGTGLDNTTGANVIASPSITTIYTATGTISMTGCSASTTATVTVYPIPVLSINSSTICAGSSATLMVNGATTYSWEPGASLSATSGATVMANPTITTIYTVSGSTDGCTGVETATVVVNPLPTATISASGPIVFCQGDSVILTSSIGTNYVWSNGAFTQSISVLNSGDYSVTVTDANGCSATSAVSSVTVNPLPVIIVNDGFVCSGDSVALIAMGASTYSWSPDTGLNATTGATVIAKPSGTMVYTVTGTNTDGCLSTSTSTVTVAPTISLTVNSASLCIGSSTSLTATGANTYSWSPSTGLDATSGSMVMANPTVTTIYTITGTAGTCSISTTATVTVNALPVVSINVGGPTTFCDGDSVTLTASAGISYAWSNSATTQSISVMVQGNYSVTVTDANGCSATSSVVAVTVNPLPTASITGNSSTTFCQGDSVTLVSSLGTSYLWSTSAITQSITVYSGGNYSVTVTGANGCMATSSVTTVVVNPLPTATISVSGSLVFCQGDSVILTSSIGTSYLWSNGAITQSISVLNSGDYSVTVTDANGCSATSAAISATVNVLPVVTVNDGFVCSGDSVTLTATGASTYSWSPAVSLNATTGATVIAKPSGTTVYTVTGTNTDGCLSTSTSTVTVAPTISLTVNSASLCIGSSTSLTATGANTYSWSPSTGLDATSGSMVMANPTVTTIYTITGTAGTCSISTTATVTVNALPVVSINVGGPTTFCDGDSVALTASAGSSYAWSNSATTQSISVMLQDNYSVTVTDANGCSATSSVVTVTVNQLPIITANDGYICNGGSALLTAMGASTYTWSPGTGLSSMNGATVTATPSVNTTYTLMGTNSNGCVNQTTVSVSIVADLTLTVNSATICEGTSVTLNATGATNYSWSPSVGLNSTTGASVSANPTITTTYTVTGSGGNCTTTTTLTVTVKAAPTATISANGPLVFCQGNAVTLTSSMGSSYLWSEGSTTPSIVINSSGDYSVEVTGANGCSATSSVAAVVVNPIPSVTVTASGSTTICQGENVILTASGGSSYLWSNSATSQSIMISSAGNFTVKVTDANGCTGTSAVTSISVNLTPTIAVNVNGPTTFCQGKSVTLTASPATGYLWSNNDTTQTIVVATAGDYSVTITDSNGCMVNSSVTTVSVNPAPFVDLGADTTVCGCILLNAFNPGASYSWNTGADYSMINVCYPGTYWVSVSNGICITRDTIHVVAYSIPLVNISVASGSVSILNAGNPGASYLWNTGETTQTILADSAGKYYVTVTNQAGCQGSDTLYLGIVGIKEGVSSGNQVKIYPNPNNGIFTIDLLDDKEIEITNILGERIREQLLVRGKNQISLEDQADGIYFVKIRYDHGQETIKILKGN
ncbi:MAG: T9SS type A sorting domain-containing protein [Bacteroidota bacterium]